MSDQDKRTFHFVHGEAFDEDWRNWLDNPPVDWMPPLGATKVYTQTLDMMTPEQGMFAMRFDGWIGEAGLHVHVRVVILYTAPDTIIRDIYWKRRKWWQFWRPKHWVYSQEDDKYKHRIYSKKLVGSYVVPWGALYRMEEFMVDPTYPQNKNGKTHNPGDVG
jgi:hypothetical protein